MARNHGGYNTERSEFYGAMQRVVDTLFYEEDTLLEAHSAAPGAANTGALRDVAPAESAVAGSARSAAPAAQWEGAAASSGADALRDDASGAVRSGAHAADSQGSFAQRLGVPASTAALLGLAAFDDPALRSAAMGDAAGGAAAVAMGGATDGAAAEAGSAARNTIAEAGRVADGATAAAVEVPAFTVRRLDVVIAAESADLPDDLMRIVNLLPPGNYTRQRLCDQINSAITGHAWGQVYGTVS